MCHLVTIGVQRYDGDPVATFRAKGLEAAPAVNLHVRSALPRGATLLDITDGRCSCSFYRNEVRNGASNEASMRTKYARKGWSEAKIARALESKRAAHQHRPQDKSRVNFRRSIEELVLAGGHIALFSHFYSGLFSAEQLDVAGNVGLPLRDFIAQEGTFPEDVVVMIT